MEFLWKMGLLYKIKHLGKGSNFELRKKKSKKRGLNFQQEVCYKISHEQ